MSEIPSTEPDACARAEQSPEQRVEFALRRLQASWLNRQADPAAVEQDLDELDVAIGLRLEPTTAAPRLRLARGKSSRQTE
jgi:hypothetical protein